MNKRALDLFCKAGGTSMGLHRAGYEVTGVDIEPQKRYPFQFVLGDALEYVALHGHKYDLIVAGPPCQLYSVTAPLSKGGAPLQNPLMLCGTMFPQLRVRRHRLFECWPVIWWPPAACYHWGKVAPSFGKGSYDKSGYDFVTVAGRGISPSVAGPAMGIDWMIGTELSQAIPPPYFEWLGRQMLRLI